jgi:hypothetical protein
MENSLLDALEKLIDEKNAMNVGIALLTSNITIEEKKTLFEKAFNMELPDKIEAIINLWAVGVMLEDDLSVVQKISAVRGFLKDPAVDVKWISEWIRQVWKRNEAPKDMLDFIAIDLRNHPGIAEDLKKMLFEDSSI